MPPEKKSCPLTFGEGEDWLENWPGTPDKDRSPLALETEVEILPIPNAGELLLPSERLLYHTAEVLRLLPRLAPYIIMD